MKWWYLLIINIMAYIMGAVWVYKQSCRNDFVTPFVGAVAIIIFTLLLWLAWFIIN